jgi:hypothetical protein
MGTSKTLKKAIQEEGLSHFSKLILAVFPTREKALAYEVLLHNRFNVNKDPMFYNKAKQTSTGFDFQAYGPDNHKYGTHPKGRKLTEEEKEKLRQINLGHVVSPETRQKIRVKKLGKKHSEEQIRKFIKAKTGKELSIDARKNQSKAMSGEKNPMYGRPVSQETRNKRSEGVRKSNQNSYIYVTPIGEFSSSNTAAKALHCSKHAVLERCKKEFEGYCLKTIENKYKKKKEEFERLLVEGYSITEMGKILEIDNSTLLRWKHKKAGTTPNVVGIKLTPTKVLELRYLYDLGVPIKVIQKEFDLGKTQIFRIGKRQSWTHIPEELSPIDPSWQKNYCM